jgi:hypothetical protein
MKYFCALLLVFSCFLSYCQPAKFQFRKVSEQEMVMARYERDTTAQAVVLYDKGYYRSSDYTFTRHLRLKVLTTAGTSYANFVLSTPAKSTIVGSTFNMENGVVTESRLESSNIYKEEIIDGFQVYKVFFPNVRAGSVIELKYWFEGFPYEWRFQDRIPIIKSELTIEKSTEIKYKKAQFGFETVNQVNDAQWMAEHVPALQVEPHMSEYTNYLTRFEFVVQSINLINAFGYFAWYASDWETITSILTKAGGFGQVIKGCPFLNDKARELKDSKLSTREKIDAALQYIKDNIKWNGISSLRASEEYARNFKDNHSGNSAEINLMLIALLNKIDIKAYPVVLSTRDNGFLNPTNPSPNSLNYVVAYIQHEDIIELADATSKHSVSGVLPVHCLNLTGYKINPPFNEVIDLTLKKPETLKQFIRITTDEEKRFIASVSNNYDRYSYLEWIKKFENGGLEQGYANHLKNEVKPLTLEKYTLNSHDKTKLKASETISIDITNSKHILDYDNDLIIEPFVLSEVENPFRSDSRRFPIDFIYPRNRSIVVSISIPSDYSIKSLPPSTIVPLPDNKGKLSYLCNTAGNTINIRCDVSINSALFSESDYELLKSFFTEIAKKMNEPVLLTKKT